MTTKYEVCNQTLNYNSECIG
uniref:Uncharacterized protein n=1 Tax=Rhizophora mucronata TaxID=61149 RepID=A0A2P2PGJ0_RHIMU